MIKKPKKYSVFSLVRNALSYHENWQPAWRNPEIKKNYDAIIVGGGGHGLTTAYYLAKNHGIKNSLNPVVTAISGWFASLLAGAVFVEYIFGWNGLGKEIVNALNNLDLPVIMGSVLVIAFMFIIINILVDIIYAWLDPRVKLN